MCCDSSPPESAGSSGPDHSGPAHSDHGLLGGITSPRDLDGLSAAELDELAAQMRAFLINNIAKTGGHLGPNLGVVELSIALHRVFDSPKDAIIFDVGHQCYPHKLLTGRHDFSDLRAFGGLSGYPSREESEHDIVENSHASAALSWADGLSRARKLAGSDDYVVAVVGDGALTGGMSWEALNNISDDNNRRLIIIVNDNGRSYAHTIGGIARFLNGLRMRKSYLWLRNSSEAFFSHMGSPGRRIFQGIRGAIHGFLSRFSSSNKLFSNLDIRYLGPVNGHQRKAVEKALSQAKKYGRPIIVHVITEKGHGYLPAQQHKQDRFHAVGVIDPSTGLAAGASKRSWTEAFGEELVRLAEDNPKIVAVTAAMLHPTGLGEFAERFPKRVFDVGIAEQHAVTAAAGLAYGGLHPVVAIYSTFMNRAFDQVLMDVALHRCPVTFVLDRAGITGPDGPSHHGVWDLSLFRMVPGLSLAAPRDEQTLKRCLDAACSAEGPTLIRFPRGTVAEPLPALQTLPGGTEVLYGSPDAEYSVLLISTGVMAHPAVAAAKNLSAAGVKTVVVDPVWATSLSDEIAALSARARLTVVIEEAVRADGLMPAPTQLVLGIPADFQPQGSREELLRQLGLDEAGIVKAVTERLAELVDSDRADTQPPGLARE